MSADRRSSRSLRRYAASVAFWTTWARADSASSRGTPVSAHQLRKLLRIPCGVPSIPRSRSSFEIVLSLSVPRTEGNISLEPSSRLRASCSTPRACWLSGTRCGRPAFMRSAGMVHVLVSRSSSDHSARRASPLRVAVSVKNVRHNFVLGLLRASMAEARTVSDPAGNAKLGKGGEGGRRERARDDAVAAAILAVSVGQRGRAKADRNGSPTHAVVG